MSPASSKACGDNNTLSEVLVNMKTSMVIYTYNVYPQAQHACIAENFTCRVWKACHYYTYWICFTCYNLHIAIITHQYPLGFLQVWHAACVQCDVLQENISLRSVLEWEITISDEFYLLVWLVWFDCSLVFSLLLLWIHCIPFPRLASNLLVLRKDWIYDVPDPVPKCWS